jgi:hypothetical protein
MDVFVEEGGLTVEYCVTFLILAVGCGIVAVSLWELFGWVGVLPAYASVSFLVLAAAYAGAGPRLLFKQADGSRSPWAWLLLAPYFALNAITFRLYCLLSREPAYAQAAPNVFFGRWLSAREHQEAGWAGILDLAAEFPAVWRPARYRSLPVLDGTAPSEQELRSAIAWIHEAMTAGPVYVHCGLGHGRSVCVVIAYLLSVGLVRTVAEGVRLLRSVRPGVRLHPSQRRLLRQFESEAPGHDAQLAASAENKDGNASRCS